MTDEMTTGEQPADEAVATLLRGLSRLPGYDGVTFRGRPAGARFGAAAGQVLVSTGLVATSRDPRVASENFTVEEMYAVVGNAGRAIESLSQHPDEHEVVFLPATMFLVLKRARVGDLPVTVVEQLDPQRDPADGGSASLEEVAGRIAAAVLSARERADTAVHSPGKFVGDIA